MLIINREHLWYLSSCNTKLFEAWVKEVLIKGLESEQIVITDNAAFHRSQRTKELIESVSCQLIFLPPYSPDLNSIKKFWANMKRWVKNQIKQFDKLYEAIPAFF
ncbi:hypothetical protein P618_200526 [Holospora obtusa F1]|uniref:Tc1-like transposase DDE domain-containing protein n=1 Tax=Holospora obtusa F1 TaxID=1399147 RepID=W6TEN1_HOLOB|nr:transposase [Holospora obtusa]ETZ07294.1 hypothetical protein P618_200526 [Holospora obtusa F1]